MAKMSFAEAKKIRGESLSNRIAGRLVGGEGFGSSVSKSLSEGTKARITGLKEKINPMNIAKFMFGGSNLAAALTGKITGASKENMQYFTGKTSKKDTASKIGPLMDQQEGMFDMLEKIHQLMVDIRKVRESEKPSEEDVSEKERKAKQRHEDLLKALGVKPGEKPTAEKIEEEDPFWKKIISWFGTPVGGFLLGLASMAALFAALYIGLEALNKITPNMKAMSPEEAENVLKNGYAKDIESQGGREFLEDIIKNGKKNAQKVLEMPEGEERTKKLLSMGGEDKVKKIAGDEKEYTVPTNIDTGPEKVPPRPDTTGGKNAGRAKSWDNKFAKNYNPDGTKKSASPVSSEANEQFKKESEDFEKKQKDVGKTPTTGDSVTPVTPLIGETSSTSKNKTTSLAPTAMAAASATSSASSTAMATASATPSVTDTATSMDMTPASASVNNVISENLDMSLQTGRDVKSNDLINNTITNTTVNTQKDNLRNEEVYIPSVRNVEETFKRMIFYSTKVV